MFPRSIEAAAQARHVFASRSQEIRALVRRVASRQGLSPEEGERFSVYVLARIEEDDCAVLRRFRGRSTLETYLQVVVLRLLPQFRSGAGGEEPSGSAGGEPRAERVAEGGRERAEVLALVQRGQLSLHRPRRRWNRARVALAALLLAVAAIPGCVIVLEAHRAVGFSICRF